MWRTGWVWMLVSICVASTALTSKAFADPTFPVMNASGGIYWRSGPDWNTAVAIAGNGFYPGTVVTVHCYQAGASNVPGSSNSMWDRASIASGPGSGSGWINEHFINDGVAINQPSPGVPPCGSDGGGSSSAPAPLPSGQYHTMNASGGIYWRSGPDWNTAVAISGNGFYPDTILQITCYQTGVANVPGSDDGMWEQVTVAGGSGRGSGWVNEHFIDDGSPINQPSPGAPPCSTSGGGATPPTPPTPLPSQTATLTPGTFHVAYANGGVYWRSAPDWTTAEAVTGNGFYPDTIVAIDCYRPGLPNVPGVNNGMWELAHVVSGSGTGSGWINEHFVADGAPVNQPSPGAHPCGSTTGTGSGSSPPMSSAGGSTVSCYGDYCSGKDPKQSGCVADASTLAYKNLSGARLELRWSARCKTEWARWIQYPVGIKSDLPTGLFAVQDTGYTQSAAYDATGGGKPTNNSASETSDGITTSWTPMIYSPVHLVRAVATVACGDQGILASAVDCYLNGKVQTDAK